MFVAFDEQVLPPAQLATNWRRRESELVWVNSSSESSKVHYDQPPEVESGQTTENGTEPIQNPKLRTKNHTSQHHWQWKRNLIDFAPQVCRWLNGSTFSGSRQCGSGLLQCFLFYFFWSNFFEQLKTNWNIQTLGCGRPRVQECLECTLTLVEVHISFDKLHAEQYEMIPCGHWQLYQPQWY